MSLRTAKKPIDIPSGVEVSKDQKVLKVKGPKGTLELVLDANVKVDVVDNNINVAMPSINDHKAITGTTCSHIKNMLAGVTNGFEKKLELVGVGYRAQLKGKDVHLTLGKSHPDVYSPEAGVTIEVPSPTEIIIKGADKQKVGQAAAKIRDFRPPEPYKGKGIKYSTEVIVKKETKKK